MAQNIPVPGMARICRSAAYAALFAAAGLFTAGSAHAASVSKGKEIFQSQCAACHSAQKGDNGIGPSLYGVYGSHAASVSGYDFSSALKSSNIVWNENALDKFLANPQGDVTGTKMTYPGLPSASKRADVIAYLKTLGGQGAGK